MKLPQIKSSLVLLLALLQSCMLYAQHPVTMRNLWDRPQVHVIFNEYTLSFKIRDIDKTLGFLREIGDSSFDAKCGLDTSLNYIYELFPGLHTEFRYPMQPILQNAVAAFLLTAGHAHIINKKHKVLPEIIVDIEVAERGDTTSFVTCYDPKTKAMIFQGKMALDLYKKDLGFDD